MSLPYFYEKEIDTTCTSFTLSEETSRHCAQVLRMNVGEQLHITDGKGNLFLAEIVNNHKKHTEVSVKEYQFIPKQHKEICIAIALVKNNARFEWFLEKAAEIGVSEIIPVHSSRTVRTHFRWDRMNNILVAAMLQSQQTWLVNLHQATEFEAVIQSDVYTKKLIAHCVESDKQEIANLAVSDNAQILIGPEGDFTAEEIDQAIQAGYLPVTLGKTRLRTETAGMVAAVLLNQF